MIRRRTGQRGLQLRVGEEPAGASIGERALELGRRRVDGEVDERAPRRRDPEVVPAGEVARIERARRR